MAKKIENKLIQITEKESATYGELIMTCVKSVERGYDYETLKKIKRVDDVINDGLEFTFEDADFEFIKSKVQSMQWGVYSNEILNFITYIIELK